MGKKSRLKQERREAKKVAQLLLRRENNEFGSICDQLRSLFSKYSAADVFVSLSVSDLWIPNISSQVKHMLAFAVAISMPSNVFTGSETISSFRIFRDFVKRLYRILPSFPMLEDYNPEPDWGEIGCQLDDTLLRIFYGGSVERIPDFINAFQLLYANNGQAKQDMRVALLAQNHLLVKIDKAHAGKKYDLDHIEIPAEPFWKRCREALFSLSELPELSRTSSGLITRLGQTSVPTQEADFGDAILTGRALPSLFVNLEDRYFPLSLRNSASIVIECWAGKDAMPPIKTISAFVSARFPKVIEGPFNIITRNERLPYVFSALILGGKKLILIITLDESKLTQLPDIELGVTAILASGEWAINPLHTRELIKIRSHDGNSPTQLNQLIFLAVLSKVSTVAGIVELPRTQAHVMSLPDFITIFDSINDTEELSRYYDFVEVNSSIMKGFIGSVDQFAAFRDTDSVLVEGAVTPSMMFIDPHWGASWRYQILGEYWDNAPSNFPDMTLDSRWEVNRDQENLYRLKAKRFPALSWSVVVENCLSHFVLEVDAQPIEAEDGRLLELLIHCIADSINQRQKIISELPIFKYQKITMICRVKLDSLVTVKDIDNSEQPLFSNWKVRDIEDVISASVIVEVNLQHVQRHLVDAIDASFEVSAVMQWIKGLSYLLNFSSDPAILEALANTSERQARFTLSIEERSVDVPYHAAPSVPHSEHYKVARRDLAIVFKEIGAGEGRYQLEEAKLLIDTVRDKFRSLVHDRIIQLKQSELVCFCIEQLDELVAKYDHKHKQIEMSLTHEVSYDRTTELAEAHEQFVQDSRNYRYLLEACLSMSDSGQGKVSEDVVIQLVASIDWLQVLYNASDTLHNGLDVAGVELDHAFVPEVFYLEMSDQNQDDFSREMADTRLGLGLREEDKVNAIQPDDSEWGVLNKAFGKDLGISFDNFLNTLRVMYRWPSAMGTNDLHFSYSAPQNEINDLLINTIEDMTQEGAEAAIALISLDPQGIRRLIGKLEDEIDVPLWEHNKRANRYTIKPLVRGNQESFIWGAAMVERAARIWRQSLTNGYMPADFDWPNIKSAVNKIKVSLEKQLEKNSESILKRATPYALGGIDFMRRFPKEDFEDVGDYDGLAYWPEINTWVSVECKYNQPAFCLKDARRLRDRIFDEKNRKAHIPKIIKRHRFLRAEMARICHLLGWPLPLSDNPAVVYELYVSRDIYWWMRNPPYSVQTEFVRVDALENWLKERELYF